MRSALVDPDCSSSVVDPHCSISFVIPTFYRRSSSSPRVDSAFSELQLPSCPTLMGTSASMTMTILVILAAAAAATVVAVVAARAPFVAHVPVDSLGSRAGGEDSGASIENCVIRDYLLFSFSSCTCVLRIRFLLDQGSMTHSSFSFSLLLLLLLLLLCCSVVLVVVRVLVVCHAVLSSQYFVGGQTTYGLCSFDSS